MCIKIYTHQLKNLLNYKFILFTKKGTMCLMNFVLQLFEV